MVRIFANSMVRFRPSLSNSAPMAMRPRPLHMESTPTSVVASAASAPTESARSRAKDITVFPTAERHTMQKKASQKEGLRIICPVE